MFTIAHRSHFVEGQTDFSPGNRVYLGPLKWLVIAIFKNAHASTGESNLMRLHMRLGHFHVQTLKPACELYKTDYKDQMKPTDKLYCCPCSITQAKQNVLIRRPHRIIEGAADSKQGGGTWVTTSINSPTEGNLASTITSTNGLWRSVMRSTSTIGRHIPIWTTQCVRSSLQQGSNQIWASWGYLDV